MSTEAPMASAERLPVDAFREQLAQLRRAPAPLIRGALKNAVMRRGASCWLCGNPAERGEWVVSARAGGQRVVENLASACEPCTRDRGGRDVLEWAQEKRKSLTAEQTRRRHDALSVSDLHAVLKKNARTVTACREHLTATRWLQPRAPLCVAVGSLDVLAGSPDLTSATAAAMLFSFRHAGGDHLGDGVIRLPVDIWRELVSDLIDNHVIVRRVRLDGDSAVQYPWEKVYGGVLAARAGSLD